MTRITFLALSLSVFVGCAYTEEEYAEDFTTAYCDRLVTCEADIVAAYSDLGLDEESAQSTYDDAYTLSCETETETEDTGTSESDCDFNPDLAKECVAAIGELSCEFWSTGTGYPASCGQVCG